MGDRIAALVEAQRPRLALWIPVFYAFGIAGYFALPVEPQGWMLAALGGMLLLAAADVVPRRADGAGAALALILPASASRPRRCGRGRWRRRCCRGR